jgi:hypothetical protein
MIQVDPTGDDAAGPTAPVQVSPPTAPVSVRLIPADDRLDPRRKRGDPRLSPEQSIFPSPSGAHIPTSCAATTVSAKRAHGTPPVKKGASTQLLSS